MSWGELSKDYVKPLAEGTEVWCICLIWPSKEMHATFLTENVESQHGEGDVMCVVRPWEEMLAVWEKSHWEN